MAHAWLGTEWCGLDGHRLYEPKSFSGFQDQQKAYAYHGLLYLLEEIGSGKDRIDTEKVALAPNSPFFAELVIGRALMRVCQKLKLYYQPSFKRTSENSARIRGRIDFNESIRKNLGLKHKHVVTFSQLSYNDPLICFLKFAIPFVSSHIKRYFHGNVRIGLEHSTAMVEGLLQSTKPPKDPFVPALELVFDSFVFKDKFLALIPEAKVLAHFIVGTHLGMKEAGKLVDDGLLLNLNRPFEKVLREALYKTGEFSPVITPINEIFLGVSPSTFIMKPDCKGWVEHKGKRTFLLLDAKHKLMDSDIVEEDGCFPSNCINRNDLYQIISYSRTHSNEEPCIYGLVGLREETEPGAAHVKTLPPININYGNNVLPIHRLVINFGSLLYNIGSCTVDLNRDQILLELGKDILSRLPV